MKKTTYTNIEELLGSEWQFNQSTKERVKLVRIDKAKTKLSGKVLTFSHIDLQKPNFETNELYFKQDFLIWADRIK
jgi:hypothetical protein